MKHRKRWISLLVVCVTIFMALQILLFMGNESNSGYKPIAHEKHQALFDAEENGFHLLQDAMDEMIEPDDSLKQSLRMFRIAGKERSTARTYVDTQREVIGIARDSLDRKYIIAPPDFPDLGRRWRPEMNILLRLLDLEAQFRGNDGDLQGMLDVYFDILSIGQAVTQHVRTQYPGLAPEEQWPVFHGIHKSLDSLDENQLRAVVDVLEKIEAQTAPLDRIIADEKAFAEKTRPPAILVIPFGVRINVDPIAGIVVKEGVSQTRLDGMQEAYNFNLAVVTGTLLQAKVRIYELAHGDSPESLKELTQDGLAPIDPSTGNPFQYVGGKVVSEGPLDLSLMGVISTSTAE